MARSLSKRLRDLDTFDLKSGRRLASKYVVNEMIGKGWEGEVYLVTEIATDIERAAKIFFPKRNIGNKALTFYAKKLNKLRECSMLIQYHTQESFRYCGETIPFLISEYVEGELLTEYINRQPGKRLHYFEALHLLNSLTAGIEEIHRRGEYHGDLHSDNVIVNRVGLEHRLKLVDLFQWGRATSAHFHDDIVAVIRIFYDALGGQKHYANMPDEVKAICCGLKRSLIVKKFRTAAKLRAHLRSIEWT
jgi:tRNA A-37 threonylcarbamoyl transferase component Bud32